FAGPLGQPSHIEVEAKRVCVIGGGVGCAAALPIAKAYHVQGTHVDIIASFKGTQFVILEEEMTAVSNEVYIMTDDGSYGGRGFATSKLAELIEGGAAYDEVICIGAPIMMRAVAEATRPHGIKTVVSLNPIMIDGTGMCGCCRVSVGGTVKFACVDGPEFDAHEIDFSSLMARNAYYAEQERKSRENCRLIKGVGM
ncbi:MAG: sulfide/dihydroorotate dehydrogenase-like FAD/NAD-binding protein, partial [Defluviitaleaceae bacterium]|nr:sulfide/dihydroorotate dehydrogenase-like FAD/NAD-binding protein [Defluviitaleaceae bacterium]